MPQELVEVLAKNSCVRIERIVSGGHKSADGFWYDQDENEWVMLLSGSATLEFEDHILAMKAGDYVLIPAHQRHRVQSTSIEVKTIWLAVFYGTDSD